MQDYSGNVINIQETPPNVGGAIGKNDMLTLETARELFSYDPDAGTILWRVAGFRRIVGGVAGVVRAGYRMITVEGQEYMAGRIAWLLTHGEWPATRVRFRNNNGADIRLENLYVDAFKWQTKERKNEKNRDWRVANPERTKNQDLKKNFDITVEDYAAMLDAQNGVCAICHHPETAIRGGKVKMLAVDHCHTEGHIRQLLCVDCNLGLGRFHDDPVRMRAAADYIEKHAGKVVPIRKDTA